MKRIPAEANPRFLGRIQNHPIGDYISEPNYGAYYEAGDALGLGKEVIISCSSAVFSKQYTEEEKRYEKYLKPHFDIAQKQILIWDDYDDLTKKLAEWIRALFE